MGLRVLGVIFAVLLATNYGLTEKSEDLMDRISFYITSQCNDTIDFITNKFYPVYQELGSELDIEFIPWGKSTRDANGSISCQFGESDCTANRFQSCALFMLGIDQERMADYMNCEFSTLSSVSLNYTCVRQVGIPENYVKECYESPLGDGLQDRAEQRTSEITMEFVPTIVYDYTYNAENQDAAYSDFRGFVCDLLQEIDPTACT